MATFLQESWTDIVLSPFKDDGSNRRVSVFKHAHSDLRVVFAPVPGPLVSATIVVPTIASNDKGLPHCLEHLCFCGSHEYKHRGYLDILATRSLSTGTNAYTCEDHTGYTITTAGGQGMLNVLPVFLEHVVHPTLRPTQFHTEVHHIDGDGKHQGVVYCEMASRENSEADLVRGVPVDPKKMGPFRSSLSR
jgi:Zn-dependent M16 (insulinase) family peptidase